MVHPGPNRILIRLSFAMPGILAPVNSYLSNLYNPCPVIRMTSEGHSMKNFLLVALLSPLLFAADQPKFRWNSVGSQTFALNATEYKSFSVPEQGKWRFELKAETAIYVGVASAEQAGRLRYVTLADYRGFSCVSTKLVAGDVDCEVQQPGERLLVRDERGPFTKGAGVIGSVRKTSEAATDRATKPNTITLTLYKWACVENCK
jgi:hypothetical protein